MLVFKYNFITTFELFKYNACTYKFLYIVSQKSTAGTSSRRTAKNSAVAANSKQTKLWMLNPDDFSDEKMKKSIVKAQKGRNERDSKKRELEDERLKNNVLQSMLLIKEEELQDAKARLNVFDLQTQQLVDAWESIKTLKETNGFLMQQDAQKTQKIQHLQNELNAPIVLGMDSVCIITWKCQR